MKSDIISKLEEPLLKGKNISEPEVLYILAQLRKLSENLEEKEINEYSVLFFYCDWALHVELNRASAKKILEDLAKNWESQKGFDIVNFKKFREELIVFLKKFNLPTSIIETSNWFEFRNHLIQILIDVPLIRRDTRIVKFSLLKKSLLSPSHPTNDYMFWYQAEFNDGRIEEWNIMLADYGIERRMQIDERLKNFFERYIAKAKIRHIKDFRKNQ